MPFLNEILMSIFLILVSTLNFMLLKNFENIHNFQFIYCFEVISTIKIDIKLHLHGKMSFRE